MLRLSDASLRLDEGGNTALTVRLATLPSAPVTVTLTQPSNPDVTLDKTRLNFTDADWSTPQTVTVSAAEDEDAADDSASVALSASGGDYAGVTDSVTVAVNDDDDELTLSEASLTIDEGGEATFTVQLKGRPSAAVTVTLMQPANTGISVDTDAATAGNQNTLAFTTGDWNDAQSVTVRAAQDGDSTDDTADIALSAAGRRL